MKGLECISGLCPSMAGRCAVAEIAPSSTKNKQVVNMFEVEPMSSRPGEQSSRSCLRGDLQRGALRAAHASGAELDEESQRQPGHGKRNERGRLGEEITQKKFFLAPTTPAES